MHRVFLLAKLAVTVGCLIATLSCGDAPTDPRAVAVPDSESLTQLQRGVGIAPSVLQGGSVPSVPAGWNQGLSELPHGPLARSLSPSATAASTPPHSRQLLLENSATGARALWVITNGVIVNSASLGTLPTSWRIVGTGDYNADGLEDIIWDNTGTGGDGSRAIWLMNGTGGVLAAVSLGIVPIEWHIAGGGDYNADGKDDILLENVSTGVRAIWLMNGGSVTNVVVIGTLFDWHMIAARDLNSDGKDDILLENTVNGNRVLWMMSGGGVQGAALLGTLPNAWHISGTTDIDGDSHVDVLLENHTTGARATWLEDGHGGVTSAPLLTFLDPVWHMGGALIPNRNAPAPDLLSVRLAGTGSGGVTSTPPGIGCGSDCEAYFEHGTVITLTASPAPGSSFAGWSGGGCTGSGTCTVMLSTATTITATFGIADVTAPTLLSSTPADATIGVAENTTIRLTFSEPMNQTQTMAAFQVISPVGVSGTFQWTGNAMTFTPSASFACTQGGVLVQWRLSTVARDLAGNPIANDVVRAFRVIRCAQDDILGESTRDGYVRSTGVVTTTGTVIHVGDYADNTFARGFVSFDFSSIPSNAVITSASLQMTMTQVGSWSQLGSLLAEPVSYGTLDAGDFSLASTGPASTADVIPGFVYWQIDAAIKDAWNNRATRGFRLQMRLRTTFDNFINNLADGFDFASAETTGNSAPFISVTYRAP